MKPTISLRTLGVLVGLVTLGTTWCHALNAGDIAFTMFNSGGTTVSSSTNQFSFVALVDIAAGTDIYFTDIGWAGSNFRTTATTSTSESVIKYTTGNITKGTQVTIGYPSAGSLTVTGAGGTVSSAFSYGTFLNLSTAGDQVLAFQGSAFDGTVKFIAGLSSDTSNFDSSTGWGTSSASTSDSMLPVDLNKGLIAGTSAVQVSSTLSAGVYTKFTTDAYYAVLNFTSIGVGSVSHTQSDWLSLINNPNNWSTGGSTDSPFANNGTTFSVSAIPEPSVYASLAGTIAMGLVLTARRKRS